MLAATPAQREAFEYLAWGTALEWPEFDLQLSVDGIIEGRREHIPPPGWYEDTLKAMKEAGIRPPAEFIRGMKGRQALERTARWRAAIA